MTSGGFIEREVTRRPAIEATLPLINVVFLLLVFFLAAGSLRTPLDRTIIPPSQVIEFEDTEFSPADWVYLDKDGALSFREAVIEDNALGSALIEDKAVLFADGQVKGRDVTRVLKAFQSAGAGDVMIVTERAQTSES